MHCIHSFSYLSWGVNNIPALFLCSACCTHVQNTNSFLWAQYCACCLLPQVEVVKFPEIIMILHAAILARGLSFFFPLSLLPNSPSSPHVCRTRLNQEHKIIKKLATKCSVSMGYAHTCVRVSVNQIIDQTHQNEKAWSWIINCLARPKKMCPKFMRWLCKSERGTSK